MNSKTKSQAQQSQKSTINGIIKENPNEVSLEFDDQAMQELQEIARQLETDPSGVLLQAYQMFRLVQGRTVVLKQKRSGTSLLIKDFANKVQRVK
ncbi:MAG: hypothetical protein PVJ09_00750 [Candidatus Woesebacteria bacterium]